ncbi:putative nonaspanin (TM9SF) [Helianthus annuus]|nr:putative nonaspanin (TM9SF) [Helianthus annuus]KAJ0553527.1 putative nonaspanin (TM9SF) [Helianthus annuus]KAJ0719197.1 putative nonaspanin (TM9SF) [Helianthus annuus]KAJ0901617.1 putative nonaspanin (TM9SF) [Helianthus annuus]
MYLYVLISLFLCQTPQSSYCLLPQLTGMVGLSKIPFVTTLLIFLGTQVNSDAYGHRYSIGDVVPIYANKVGPYSNRWEKYNYYDFPFCSPDSVHEKDNIGRMLTGESLVSTPFMIGFRVNKEHELSCKKRLNKSDVYLFRSMIKKGYQMQLYYDDLPIWGLIGSVERNYTDENKNKYFLYKHFKFGISYNKDRVFGVGLKEDPSSMVDVTNDMETDVDFTYSIYWGESKGKFEERLNDYSPSSILPLHINAHVHSIANSCFTIFIVIICLVIVIYTRFLHKDISRYTRDVEEAEVTNNQEQKGWKNIHGDVFRFPEHKSLFSAALGSGTQLLALVVIILILGVMGVFQPFVQVVFLKALVIIYAVTSVVSGYTSASFYHQLKGTAWIKNALLTGGLYFVPVFLTFSVNTTTFAVYNGQTDTFPLNSIITLFIVWIFLATPLLILGGIMGKNRASDFQAPCRTTKSPKKALKLVWYKGIIPQMVLAGFLPFSVIKIQIYDNLSAVWGHGIYTFYNSMAIMFVLLLIMTSLVSVMLTSFQLAVEDHEWWWRSFFNGGSTGLYVYGYGIYYYFYYYFLSDMNRDMNSFVPSFCFFGYMTCLGYGMFLALGTVGFCASLLFVRYMYTSVKCD